MNKRLIYNHYTISWIKTWNILFSSSVRTTRFCNNIHHIRSGIFLWTCMFLKILSLWYRTEQIFFHPVTVIDSCRFFPNVMCSHVYFNFYVNLAAPWYILVKWKYILETMMNRFPSIRQTVPPNFFSIFFNLHAEKHTCNLTHRRS